ncbi:MAG: PEP-CTERM sorting domain-containing protein [Phycisphaerales bacterium]|nr:PEP-CTERM sorting domain-containing protein [Phycisphaerales bacterium]
MLAGAASAANLRLFFSAGDPVGPGHNPLPVPAANGAMNVAAQAAVPLLTPGELGSSTNPALTPAGGRLHLWGTGDLGDPDPNVWNGIGVRIAISGGAGVGITAGGGLNVTGPTTARRWETGSDFNPTGSPARYNFIAVTRAGLQLPALTDGWGNNDNAVYLGYIDLSGNTGATAAEVRLVVDDAGISRQSGDVTTDRVFFGFGDDGLRGDAFGQSSTVADATVAAVPEPASMLLVGLAALALRRR